MSDYEITNDDVAGMMHYLANFHPEQANEETARSYLAYLKAKFREISLKDLSNEKLEEMFEAYTQSKGQNI